MSMLMVSTRTDMGGEGGESKADACEKFQAGDSQCGKARSRQAKAREEFGHVGEMVEFAPTTLNQLDSPVQANEEQERRLKISNEIGKLVIASFCCSE